MKRLLETTLTRLLLLGLVALGVMQVWQLNRIEGRLVAIEADGAAGAQRADPRAPSQAASADAMIDCTKSDWWASDQQATAEPGNALAMHTRCKVQAEHVESGGTFRRVWAADLGGLNPYGDAGNNADVREIFQYVSAALAYRHPEQPSVWSPDLAQSASWSPDGRVLTVRLRQGVLWHPPQVDLDDPRHAWLRGDHELTADDYLFVFNHVLDPAPVGRFGKLRGSLDDLLSTEKLDKYTFRLTFGARRYATLGVVLELDPVASWLYGFDEDGKPIPAASFAEGFGKHWFSTGAVGVGPYRFGEWRQGESITLVRNPGYFGEPAAFEAVRLQIIKDKAGWPRALENQELDLVYLQPSQYRTAVGETKGAPVFGDPHVKVKVHDTWTWSFVGWNRTNPRLTDRRVRQALSMAVDRPALLEHVYYGLGELMSGPIPPSQVCYDKSIPPWPFDPTQAQALLTEAGWVDADGDGVRENVVAGKRLDLRLDLLVQGTSEEWVTMANQMVESLRKVGVVLELVALETKTLNDRKRALDFDAFAGAWTMGADYTPRELWHSSTAGSPETINYVGFRDPAVDALIEDFETDFDEARRTDTCHKIHAALHDDEPYMFMFSRRTPVLWWDWLNDVELFPSIPNRDLRYYSFNQRRP